jgi:hypothetical protein
LFAGLFLGLSVYSYSTARLLSFLLVLSVVLIYLRKVTLGKIMVILLTFFLSLIPFIIFSIGHPDALTKRFEKISYLDDPSASSFEKTTVFIERYAAYSGPDFLLFHGDKNLSHATGYGGEVFIAVFVLFVIGLAWLITQNRLFKNKFLLLIFVNLWLSPVAGSLTTGRPHALRSILLGLYIVIFSCYGLARLLLVKEKMKQGILITAVFVILLCQVCLYVNDYFTKYEKKSAAWFEGYDFKNALITAIARNPEQIIVSDRPRRSYVFLKFYENFVSNPRRIPVYTGSLIPEENACLMFFPKFEYLLDQYPYKFEAATPGSDAVRVRCY